MKLLSLSFLLFLVSLSAWAGSDFQYVFSNPVAHDHKYSSPVETNLIKEGYVKWKLPGNITNTVFAIMDEVWVSPEGQKAVFVKHRLETTGTVPFNKFIQNDKGVSFHEQFGDKVRLTYFHGFNVEEARALMPAEICKPSTKTSRFSIISEAHADDRCDDIGVENKFTQFALDFSKKVAPENHFLHSIIAGGGECLSGLGQGMWDATGGVVVSLGEGAWNLVTSPKETLNKISDSFVALGKMVTNIRETMGAAYTAVLDLPPAAQSKFFCQLISTVGTSVIVGAMSFGSATPALLAAMAKTLTEMNATLKSEKVSAAIISLEKKSALLSEEVALIIKHEGGKKVAEKAAQAKAKMDEYAKADKASKELTAKLVSLETKENMLKSLESSLKTLDINAGKNASGSLYVRIDRLNGDGEALGEAASEISLALRGASKLNLASAQAKELQSLQKIVDEVIGDSHSTLRTTRLVALQKLKDTKDRIATLGADLRGNNNTKALDLNAGKYTNGSLYIRIDQMNGDAVPLINAAKEINDSLRRASNLNLSPAQVKELKAIQKTMDEVASGAESANRTERLYALTKLKDAKDRIANFGSDIQKNTRDLKAEALKKAVSDKELADVLKESQKATAFKMKKAKEFEASQKELQAVVAEKSVANHLDLANKAKIAAYYGVVISTSDLEESLHKNK